MLYQGSPGLRMCQSMMQYMPALQYLINNRVDHPMIIIDIAPVVTFVGVHRDPQDVRFPFIRKDVQGFFVEDRFLTIGVTFPGEPLQAMGTHPAKLDRLAVFVTKLVTLDLKSSETSGRSHGTIPFGHHPLSIKTFLMLNVTVACVGIQELLKKLPGRE